MHNRVNVKVLRDSITILNLDTLRGGRVATSSRNLVYTLSPDRVVLAEVGIICTAYSLLNTQNIRIPPATGPDRFRCNHSDAMQYKAKIKKKKITGSRGLRRGMTAKM